MGGRRNLCPQIAGKIRFPPTFCTTKYVFVAGPYEVLDYQNTVDSISNYRCTGDICHGITIFRVRDVP